MLYEELSQKFPSRVIEPFREPVLIIGVKEFKPQWEEQLKAEGCKILLSDYLGRASFLIRKPQPSNNSTLQQTQIEEKPQPQNIEETIIGLIKQGLAFKEIRQTLNLSHTQLMGHLSGLRKKGILDKIGYVPARRKHLKKSHLPNAISEVKPFRETNLDVKELLQVSLKILDEHPRIAKFLLQKCMEQLQRL